MSKEVPKNRSDADILKRGQRWSGCGWRSRKMGGSVRPAPDRDEGSEGCFCSERVSERILGPLTIPRKVVEQKERTHAEVLKASQRLSGCGWRSRRADDPVVPMELSNEGDGCIDSCGDYDFPGSDQVLGPMSLPRVEKPTHGGPRWRDRQVGDRTDRLEDDFFGVGRSIQAVLDGSNK